MAWMEGRFVRRGNIEGSEPAQKEISLILSVTNSLNVCIT